MLLIYFMFSGLEDATGIGFILFLLGFIFLFLWWPFANFTSYSIGSKIAKYHINCKVKSC